MDASEKWFRTSSYKQILVGRFHHLINSYVKLKFHSQHTSSGQRITQTFQSNLPIGLEKTLKGLSTGKHPLLFLVPKDKIEANTPLVTKSFFD
ncbi:hypothetical protein B4Q04_20340 [Zobellia sp. OII3]|nr:hypothetical protein B4Q04_20340 [Zobellia sp. OII3]